MTVRRHIQVKRPRDARPRRSFPEYEGGNLPSDPPLLRTDPRIDEDDLLRTLHVLLADGLLERAFSLSSATLEQKAAS